MIAEGYATAASILEANQFMGIPKDDVLVIIAVDAYNMEKVANNLARAYPNLKNKAIICADNDRHFNADGTPELDPSTNQPQENAGVKAAEQAAKPLNAKILIPEYPKDANKPLEKLDANDLANYDKDKDKGNKDFLNLNFLVIFKFLIIIII